MGKEDQFDPVDDLKYEQWGREISSLLAVVSTGAIAVLAEPELWHVVLAAISNLAHLVISADVMRRERADLISGISVWQIITPVADVAAISILGIMGANVLANEAGAALAVGANAPSLVVQLRELLISERVQNNLPFAPLLLTVISAWSAREHSEAYGWESN